MSVGKEQTRLRAAKQALDLAGVLEGHGKEFLRRFGRQMAEEIDGGALGGAGPLKGCRHAERGVPSEKTESLPGILGLAEYLGVRSQHRFRLGQQNDSSL